MNFTRPDSSHRTLLILQIADRFVALPAEDAVRIVPMAELACPPGSPSSIEGILNLAGTAIPVLRLDRLFGLPSQKVTAYSMLVILRGPLEAGIAVLADRVREILPVSADAFLPIDRNASFNGCAEATIAGADGTIHLLSPARILVAQERLALSEFQAMAQQRLDKWGIAHA